MIVAATIGAIFTALVVITVLLRVRRRRLKRDPGRVNPHLLGSPEQRFEGQLGAETILRSGGNQPV